VFREGTQESKRLSSNYAECAKINVKAVWNRVASETGLVYEGRLEYRGILLPHPAQSR